MRARGLLACGASLATGCSFIFAGDLDAARDIQPGAEAGDLPREAGVVTDTGAGDVPIDAPIDAPDDQDAESVGAQGCAAYQPAPKFCADFNDANGLNDWKITSESGGSSVIQSEQFFSSPSSAKVTAKDIATDCKYSRISRAFANIGSSPRLTVTLRMRLQSPWPDGMIPLVIEQYPNGTSQFCSALFFISSENGSPTGAHIDVQSDSMGDHDVGLAGFPSTDEWTEMKVVVSRRDGGGATYETTFIDPNGFRVTSSSDFPECPDWSNAEIHLGVHCDKRAATMFYDDVRVDWE